MGGGGECRDNICIEKNEGTRSRKMKGERKAEKGTMKVGRK